MKIFGEEVRLRTHYCGLFSEAGKAVENPYVNLFVRFKGCNAKCLFCEYADTAKNFNFDKYKQVLEELKKVIHIQRINFTGGEPTLQFDNFKKAVSIANDLDLSSGFVLNTNGYQLERVLQDDLLSARIDAISLSRHHYDDDLNNKILGFTALSSDKLKELQNKLENKNLIQLSCNLIKNYIDNPEDIYKFLEYTSELGIKQVGLVSLMPINEFCENNFIDIKGMNLINNKFNLIKERYYKDACYCKNYYYIPNNPENLVKFYYKNTSKPMDIEILVFDGENLRINFDGKIIF
ncbi:radical SAM protein [Candidatus Dojkabacteria bacterium]|jgi:pyruvate-formate lyase-activating enzyme|nr:radical SAM protein [Candidatus Dojkabacteria bacterium]